MNQTDCKELERDNSVRVHPRTRKRRLQRCKEAQECLQKYTNLKIATGEDDATVERQHYEPEISCTNSSTQDRRNYEDLNFNNDYMETKFENIKQMKILNLI